jgi:signal peptidase II
MTPRLARVLLFSTALLTYLADRFAKILAIKTMFPGQSIGILPGIFHITLVLNKGAAFGILKDQAALFIFLSAFIVTLIILYAWKGRVVSAAPAAALGLVLGGALGNLVDRASYRYVIDYFDFRIWPVFNIADSAICIGVTILALIVLTGNNAKCQSTKIK